MSNDRPKNGPEKISGILDSLLQNTGINRRSGERRVLDDWVGIVGENIAGNSRPVDIRDGVLYLEAGHPAWRQELNMLFPEIIEKMNRIYGEGTVKEIKWTHGGNR
jgi:predicted nucleic acid-binding Zn ribbon protein